MLINQSSHSTASITDVINPGGSFENLIERKSSPVVLPFLFIHIYECIFLDGRQKKFRFELSVKEDLPFSIKERWWAHNIRSIHSEYGIPCYSHSKPHTYINGKLSSSIKTVPRVYCAGRFIDTGLFEVTEEVVESTTFTY